MEEVKLLPNITRSDTFRISAYCQASLLLFPKGNLGKYLRTREMEDEGKVEDEEAEAEFPRWSSTGIGSMVNFAQSSPLVSNSYNADMIAKETADFSV